MNDKICIKVFLLKDCHLRYHFNRDLLVFNLPIVVVVCVCVCVCVYTLTDSYPENLYFPNEINPDHNQKKNYNKMKYLG